MMPDDFVSAVTAWESARETKNAGRITRVFMEKQRRILFSLIKKANTLCGNDA